MKIGEKYCLSQYQDLGELDDKENIRLKRHRIYGHICVEKHMPLEVAGIYEFVKENPAPYFPVIYECIKTSNETIIIEEYIDGRNIEEMLQEKLFDEEKAVEIILEICQALSILHHAKPQIVYKDLTAENVMISNSGCVKIIDFDISREAKRGQSRDTQLLGTREYAAPEQYGYRQTDNRSDIFSAGVLLNYMVLKKFPYQKTLKGRLSSVIERCMKLDPKDRYQSVEELEDHLRELYPQYDYKGEYQETLAKRLIPPGFRSRTPWKMVVAVFGYLIITYFCFTMEVTRENKVLSGLPMIAEQIILWTSQMVFIAIVGDYQGCKRYFPILKQKNRVIQLIVYVILEFILVFIAAFFCTIKDLLLL